MKEEALLIDALSTFNREKKFSRKGPLCVALIVTDFARQRGLPLDADTLITDGGGQVLGLGKSAVQNVLLRHGITRVLASEGGRTSRGSIGNMRDYVGLLNSLRAAGPLDLDAVEDFWIARVRDFFSAKPFKISLDGAHGLRAVVKNLLDQAEGRQRESGGTMYVGAVMQHLVGAKLDCVMGPGRFLHNSFTTSDAQSGRSGDFFIGDVAIHVTTAPGEAVISRCRANLTDGYRALIVTRGRGVTVAEALADASGLGGRIDVFEIEQFVALGVYELGAFTARGRADAVSALAQRYNEIIDEFETDPSLRVEFRA